VHHDDDDTGTYDDLTHDHGRQLRTEIYAPVAGMVRSDERDDERVSDDGLQY
jgi:hypothetical protein